MNKFVIPHELMDLNKFINLQRGNRYGGAKAKKDQTNLCTMYIKRAMANGLKVKQYPITIRFKWVMPNRRKDKDNIAFAKKRSEERRVGKEWRSRGATCDKKRR